jgi:copper chaperone CopZ
MKPTESQDREETAVQAHEDRPDHMPGGAPERARAITLGGAVLAALAASSCCIGPLVLAALGVGGAGAFAVLGAYRPYILAGTAVLLACGFYLTYRRPRAAEGDACGCERPNPKAGRAGRIGLWIATAMVIVLAAAPNLIACFASRHDPTTVATTATASLEHTTIRVEGMDCEACATHIRGALAKVGGFHDLKLDLKGHTIDVTYEPAAGRLQAYVAAIDELGYEASLPAQARP